MSDQPVALYRLGDEGVVVRSIRALLRATRDLAPAAPVEAEGPGAAEAAESPHSESQLSDVYDEELARAVRAFQQRRGLIVDGMVGPQTYIALDGARWTLGDRILSHTPGHLLQGDDVAQLQERLLALGFSPDRVDGVFGANTEKAVRRFQCGGGLAVDGQPDPALEAPDSLLGVGTKHAIDPVRAETQGQEALLELSHVVTLQQMAGGVGEDAIAQSPAGTVEGNVGLWSDHAVDDQTSPLLERPHRAGQLLVVDVGELTL